MRKKSFRSLIKAIKKSLEMNMKIFCWKKVIIVMALMTIKTIQKILNHHSLCKLHQQILETLSGKINCKYFILHSPIFKSIICKRIAALKISFSVGLK